MADGSTTEDIAYPGLAFTKGAIFGTFAAIGFVVMELFAVAGQLGADPSQIMFYTLLGYGIFIACVALGAWLSMFVGRRWKARAERRSSPEVPAVVSIAQTYRAAAADE